MLIQDHVLLGYNNVMLLAPVCVEWSGVSVWDPYGPHKQQHDDTQTEEDHKSKDTSTATETQRSLILSTLPSKIHAFIIHMYLCLCQ